MKENKSRNDSPQSEQAISMKGFYIALAACVFVIGIAVWAMFMPINNLRKADVANKSTVSTEIAKPGLSSKPDTSFKTDVSTEKDGSETILPESVETITPDEEETVSVSAPVFMWPVYGATAVGYFDDELVYNPTMMDWRTHPAIDIEAELGAKVMAIADGTVKSVYNDDLLGTTVVISHGSNLESIYANLTETPTVSEGDCVAMSSVIGAVGNTAIGESGQAMHLHFAMTQNGEYVDPENYLP